MFCKYLAIFAILLGIQVSGTCQTVQTTIPLYCPTGIAVNSITNKVYVSNISANSSICNPTYPSGALTVVDGTANSSTIPGGWDSVGVVLDEITNRIFVANSIGNVRAIDGTTGASIDIPGTYNAMALAVNPVTHKVYAAISNGGVAVIDEATNTSISLSVDIEGHVNFGPYLPGQIIAVNSSTNKIYVANYSMTNGFVTVIDGATNATSTVPTGRFPWWIGVDQQRNKIYVANYRDYTITAIDGTSNNATTVNIAGNPQELAVNQITGKVYVVSWDSPGVTVIDEATQNTSTIPTGIPALSVAVNESRNRIYVGSAYYGMAIIDGMTNAITPLQIGSSGLAVNRRTGLVYAVDFPNSVLSVIQDVTSTCANAGGDTDGDGLCDDWERYGLTVNLNGTQTFINLPSMGADPNHKDIFVQADYMVNNGLCLPFIGCFLGHTHKPKSAAISSVISAFANAPMSNPDGTEGIHLHVDCGRDCVMNPITGQTWGDQSQAHSLAHTDVLGTMAANGYDWTAFDRIKAANLSPARAPIFHYVVWAHELGGMGTSSGLSRGFGASDFIVSLGGWTDQVGTVLEQGGTLMHELGHNLSLHHGGGDDLNRKPNYLSVMNYLFQTTGLTIGSAPGHLDYSRFSLPALDENNLDEPIGLNGGGSLSIYGTSFYCQNAKVSTPIDDANGPIDWNCDRNSTETGISVDIHSGGAAQPDNSLAKLVSFNDWPSLQFVGGSVGNLGIAPGSLPEQTPVQQEVTAEMDASLTKTLGVSVTGSGAPRILPNTSAVLTFTVSNVGVNDDAYSITVSSTVNWAQFNGVPAKLVLRAGSAATVTLPITIPSGVAVGTLGRFTVTATSQTSPSVLDNAEVTATVVAAPNVGISSTPRVLWPPTGKTSPVAISGSVLATEFAIDPSSVWYAVTDQYGLIQPSGHVVPNADGTFLFTIPLQASRRDTDLNGRKYTITVGVYDQVGIPGSASVSVLVPHDLGN